MKKILPLLFVLSSYLSFAQCTYPTANTQASIQTFCVDNPNRTLNVNTSSNQYVRVNVVQGFQYTFSVGNVYNTIDENINVYEGTTNAQIISATGANGTSINWTATFSGDIKIIVSQGACVHTNTSNVSLKIDLTAIGNTFDDITTAGTNTWVGHVYNWVGTSPPPGGSTSPATPQNTFPFQDTNYVGYYNVGSETIAEGFGGNDVCFPVLSNGVIRTNIRTEVFAVRYRMTSTRPAGCYIISMRGDDGIRLYNDGALVFSEWKEQGPTGYTNVLVFLDGNADLIFDYYENGGQNVLNFSITPFNAALNTIANPTSRAVCSNVSPGILNGSTFSYVGSTINPTIAYQWQISNDNSTYTNIPGATLEDYTPPAIVNTGATDIIYYYRRVMGPASNPTLCNSASNAITVTTTSVSVVPVTTAATLVSCTGFTANWNPSALVNRYRLDLSTVSNFATFVSTYTNRDVGTVTSFTITGLVAGTYYYRIRTENTCGTSVNSGTIMVNTTILSRPIPKPATTVSCDGFTANWSPVASATAYFIDVATTSTFDAGTFITGLDNTNVGNITSVNLTNIYSNPVYYRVRALGSCGTSSNSSVVTVDRATTTWNGSTWSIPPTTSTLATINGNYDTTINGNFECCSLNVNAGFTLTITSDRYALVQNNLNVSGTLNVMNNGSLVQVNDIGVNTGVISYQRSTTGNLFDYVYWSSPVNGATTPGGNIYAWDTVVGNPNGGQGNWFGAANTAMSAGIGYIMRDVFSRNFVGTPRNGIYNTAIQRGSDLGAGSVGPNGILRLNTDDNWNLLGNPYPSAISVSKFIAANPIIDGFVRVWPHSSPLSSANADPFYNDFVYNYRAGDYIAINASGATSGAGTLSVIGSGQGFFVLMNEDAVSGNPSTTSVVFNNSMRDKGYSNSQFYRTTANTTTSEDTLERHRIWLDFISPSETTRTLIAYAEGATMQKDRLFDALTDYEPAQNFYSLIDTEIMTIQGRSLPFDRNDQLPLGFKTSVPGNFTIAIAEVDGLFSTNQNIYLEDKSNGIIHNLKVNPYRFTSTAGINNSRFVIRYTNETLGSADFTGDASAVFVTSNNGLTVTSTQENIAEIEVYDLLGRKLYQSKNIDSQAHVMHSIQKTNSGLILTITLTNGKKVLKKTIY